MNVKEIALLVCLVVSGVLVKAIPLPFPAGATLPAILDSRVEFDNLDPRIELEMSPGRGYQVWVWRPFMGWKNETRCGC
jgi:hypothetical protein